MAGSRRTAGWDIAMELVKQEIFVQWRTDKNSRCCITVSGIHWVGDGG